MKNRDKYNQFWVGFTPAMLLPILTFLIFWRINFTDPLGDYVLAMQRVNRLSAIVSLCNLPNLLVFFGFVWTDRVKSSRGVVLATMLFAALVFILKLA